MITSAITGGFGHPSHDAARSFRALLDALSRPGRIVTLTGAVPPAPLSVAAGIAILTLADGTTPIHLTGAHDCAEVCDWITFHTGAPIAAAADAMFAVGVWDALKPVDRFSVGTAEYPDRAATLLVECAQLTTDGARLTGPGIEDETFLSLPETAAFQANRALFPQGFDCLLTAGDRLAGLPRSTSVEAV